MDRTVTITLAGRPLPLDVDAYDALKAWLSRTEIALAADAGRAEILADFEEAISERCLALLAGRAHPLSRDEMSGVLKAIGPVAGASEAPPVADPWARKLYRVYDRQSWTGVSLGLARWRDLDVNWVRLFWLAATTATAGVAAGVYFVLAITIPPAPGPEGSKPSKNPKTAGQQRRTG